MSRIVLCVDDDPTSVEIVSKVLRPLGLQVVGVNDPTLAVDTARNLLPDLILLDLLMPGLNGWETLDRLRAVPQLADIPVVILTAKGSPYDRLVGENVARVSGYVSKPYRMDELREVIQRLL